MPTHHHGAALYNQQAHAGGPFQFNHTGHSSIDTSGTIADPRLSTGDRMTCIVNASVTIIAENQISQNLTKHQRSGGFGGNIPTVGSALANFSDSSSSNQPYHQSRSRASSSQSLHRHSSQQFRHEDSPLGKERERERDRGAERLRLYVFGGFDQYTDVVNNDLYRLDVETMTWEKLIYTKGELPSKRNDHSASLWGDDRIVIFGGSDETNQYCNDIHILNIRTMTWEAPEVDGFIPAGRVKHAATIIDNKLYVSGGCLEGEEKDGVSQELLCLDLLTWEWDEPIDFVSRYNHTLFAYREKLFAYGGYNEEMDRTGVIAYMDLQSAQVTKVNVYNDIAPNVAAQQYSQVCGHYLVVVISQGLRSELQKFTGGIWTLDLDCFQWTKHDDWKILGENHTWHYFSMERDGDQFYLIGDVNDSDEYFKQILTVDLREYGSFQEPTVNIGNELGRLLQDQMSLADFRIICIDTSNSPEGHDSSFTSVSDMDHDMTMDSQPVVPSMKRSARPSATSSLAGSTSNSRAHTPQQDPILCHKLILMARWPHFANMVQSGMIESQTNTLTIPEPYETVRAFVEYLYTDSIYGMNTDTIADLLVLGNMYVMDRLVQLCSSVLHQQIDIETVSRIYHRAGVSGQIGLRQRALKFMFRNYGPVSKTIGFRSLPKEALFDFWDSTPDGAVINISM
ncbi:hypothetical protein BGZ74_000177 [Mortierella antarctica]|nr:hypothetical protein BGZ74_000177 [Mortierella antarctica]